MARTLCILPLIALAAYLAWSPPEAAGSAPTAEAHSALPLAAVSPSDTGDAGWPLDNQRSAEVGVEAETQADAESDIQADSEAEFEADVEPAATIAARPKPSKARRPAAPAISAPPTTSPREAGTARESSTTEIDDTISQPIDHSIDRAADVSDIDSNSAADAEDDTNSETGENFGDDSSARPATAPARRPLSSDQRALSTRVRRVLNTYYKRQLNSRDHNPWEMMHAIIAYGVHTKVHRGGPKAPTVNAVSYLCWNGPCHGLELLYLDKNRVNARKGPYVQGHYAQLLAILAQSRVPKDYPLRVGDRKFTIADLIETEKLTCDEGMELTFKLIAFSHYCDSDMTWKNDKGDEWDIPRLIKEELKAPILSNAACGGTHRLTALAYAVRNRAKQGHEIDGAWLRAQKYLNDYHRYNFSLQNSDGSFSTEWFRRREARDDLDRRLQTSGHILEWFVYSLPEEQLTDPRVVKAVKYLSGILAAQPSREWEIGPLGHAIHALAIYDQRVFKAAETGSPSEPIAQQRPAVVAPRRHTESLRTRDLPPAEETDVADDAHDRVEQIEERPLTTSAKEDEAATEEHASSAHPESAETALAAPVSESITNREPSDERAASDSAADDPIVAAESPVMEEPLASAGTASATDLSADSSSVSSAVPSAVSNDVSSDVPSGASTDEVPEVARRGLLRRPFARRPRAGEAPATSEHGPATQPPAVDLNGAVNQTPTDAATAEAESVGAEGAGQPMVEDRLLADESDCGEFECTEVPTETSTSSPMMPPAATEPLLSNDLAAPDPVIEPSVPAEPSTTSTPTTTSTPATTAKPTQSARPSTSGEGPNLFGAQRTETPRTETQRTGTSVADEPRGEEAPSTDSESEASAKPDSGPALGAPASIGGAFESRRPAAIGVGVDPPPALPDDEPAVTEPPARQPPASQFPQRRRPIAPPVVSEEATVNEVAPEEFAPDESTPDETPLDEAASPEIEHDTPTSPDDMHTYDRHTYDAQSDDGRADDESSRHEYEPPSQDPASEYDPTMNPEPGAQGSSRRPRANSRYARPLPEYSTYPGGQTPPPHAPRRPRSGGQANRGNTAPPARGNMTPPVRSNSSPPLRGSIAPDNGARLAPRELAPQEEYGSQPSSSARQPMYRPQTNQPPANRGAVNRSQSNRPQSNRPQSNRPQSQGNSNRGMTGRGSGERPPGRSIWPWTDEDRGGQAGRGSNSARGDESSSRQRSGRGLLQGPWSE